MMFFVCSLAVILSGILLLPMLKSSYTVKAKRRILANAGVFMMTALLMVTMAVGVAAQEPAVEGTQAVATAAAGSTDNTDGTTAKADNSKGMGMLAAALATGLSCLGAGIAIASTAPAAIGAFSEDPKAFGKALIFVVLGEGVALYGLLISILIINKL